MRTITTSMIKAFKGCRRLYELQYVEQLKPIKTPEALEIGSNYHALVERILKKEPIEQVDMLPFLMAEQFQNKILPGLPEIKEVEKEFKIEFAKDKHLVGKIDAVTIDGIPVEHKTTSAVIDEKYIDKLRWDDQITNYLIALTLESGKLVKDCIYTVIRKPSIRQKQNETFEEYFKRCTEWYEEDTDAKVRIIKVNRSQAEMAKHQEELEYIFNDVEKCTNFYRNPQKCMFMGCPYMSICLDYTPGVETVEFVKKTKRNEELEGDWDE